MHMPASDTERRNGSHWPTLVLGFVVALVFLVSIFSFQLPSTEFVVITTFGKPHAVRAPGLHFRWPMPVQHIYRFDKRSRTFEGNIGKLEETYTADGKNVTIGLFVVYRIEDPVKLFTRVKTISKAEDRLNDYMRTRKNAVIGKYKFDQLVNTDPQKMQIQDVEKKIHEYIAQRAEEQLGISVEYVGIKSLGLPEKISEKVFKRMISEREVAAETYRARGKQVADETRTDVDKQRDSILADARAEAKRIRAEGDAKAAAFYAVFKEEPQLAVFLRKLEALKKITASKTTLILDTNSPPFDLLKLDAEKLQALQGKD